MLQEVKVKSLYKALRVMECFTVDKPELGITEISEQLGLYKSNVFNIVDTFVKMGFLEKNPDNDRYRLGFKILELSQVMASSISFRQTILPYMQKLAEATNETIYLGVPNEGEVVYLDSCSPPHQLSTRSMLGVKAPLYCTGIGKSMLAFLPEQTVNQVLDKGLKSYTDQTITDRDGLLKELAAIRGRGYSIDNMEHEYGIKCIGMPIRDKRGNIAAGLSISGPSLRFDENRLFFLADKLRETIGEIERKI